MELRQLRYFVSIVELGSMGKAALESGVATAALSQQIARLENELGVRLLLRQVKGTSPTSAGWAFYRRAQLILRHADEAVGEARHARLTGSASVGFTPATAAVLGGPLLQAMRERYPDVRLHLVEAFSGYLAQMLNTRKLDLAILFQTEAAQRWSCVPLLKECLFAVCAPTSPHGFSGATIRLQDVADKPMLLPSRAHGLRAMLEAAFAQIGRVPRVEAEIDSLGLLMEAVRLGYGITIQQSAVAARPPLPGLGFARISDEGLGLQNMLVSLAGDEASPAVAVAGKMVHEVATRLVRERQWIGAELNQAQAGLSGA